MWLARLVILWATFTAVIAYPPQIDKLNTVMDHINQLYVKEAPPDNLTDHAISGMLAALDPHSQYLNPEEAQHLQMLTKGSFVGIGVSLKLLDEKLTIMAIMPNGPAQVAGLKLNDVITHINGNPINPSALHDNIHDIRGTNGDTLHLSIATPTPHDVLIKRAHIDLQEIHHKMLVDDIAYIQLNLFNKDTIKDLTTIIHQYLDAKALLIDLRYNPGGLLYAAIDAASLFLDSQKHPNANITQIISRHETRDITLPPHSKDISHHTPIFILVGQYTASGGEIFSSTLQHYQRATIIGQTTQGKGTIQTLIPLGDGSMIKLTTAYFTAPDGRKIDQHGIHPNYRIDTPDDLVLTQAQGIIHHLLNTQETTP